VAYYRIRGDIGPLQVETLRFLQSAVDRAYEEAVEKYNNGTLRARVPPEMAVGRYVDAQVRAELKDFFNIYGVRFGLGQNVTVNNRDPANNNQGYRIPDARLGKVSIDWSLILKTIDTAQVRASSRPRRSRMPL